MQGKLSTDRCLSQFKYIGLQPRPKSPSFPLINDRKATVAYRPQDHALSQDDFDRLIIDCLNDLKCQRFLTHLYSHYRIYGPENLDYVCSYFHVEKPEILFWFELMLMAGLIRKTEAYVDEKNGIGIYG